MMNPHYMLQQKKFLAAFDYKRLIYADIAEGLGYGLADFVEPFVLLAARVVIIVVAFEHFVVLVEAFACIAGFLAVFVELVVVQFVDIHLFVGLHVVVCA
jgi:hypothetical protein